MTARASTPPPPRRILVIMLRRIGDVILTTPAVRALKKKFPEADVDFLVEPPADELLGHDPHISRVLVYPRRPPLIEQLRRIAAVRRTGYDWVIDFMGNPRSALITALSGASVRAGPSHVWHRWAYSHPLVESCAPCYGALEKMRVLKPLGIETDESDFMPRIHLPPAAPPAGAQPETDEAPLNLLADRPLIGLAPASRKETRRWPAAHFAALGRLLRDRMGARLIVFWGPGERPLAEEVARGIGEGARAGPETRSLVEAARWIARCQLLVTNCNGPKHIAVALGVPTLTLHGSSDPICWNPPGQTRHQAVRREDLACIGCRSNECPYDLECLAGLSPQDVALQAEAMMAAVSRPKPATALTGE